MSSNETYFLSFLENINPVAAQNAKKMEELMFEDASSSIMKARIFAEEIVNEVMKHESIEAYHLSSLFEKILYLSREGYIVPKIQKSFDAIRFSGNKAAHDGQFDDITIAFKLHREMYNIAVWFCEVYIVDEIEIPAYRTPKPKEKEDIKDLVTKQILELLGSGQINHTSNSITSTTTEQNKIDQKEAMPILIRDLPDNQSYLLRELRRLKDSSQEAIENANQFSLFKDYLHVDRRIQLDLEQILERHKNNEKGNLILLCGSVGDGKSHLLAYLNEKKSELVNGYTIYNDATESFSPSKNAMETLEEVLQNFSDQKIVESDDRVILAINMGVLHNFVHLEHKTFTYNKLKQFVVKSGLFTQNITTMYSDDTFDLLSFGDYHAYELTEEGPKSSFYSSLLANIFNPVLENPFYLALLEDKKNNVHTMAHENFIFFQNPIVQKQIVNLLIQAHVKHKLVISARAFLNFVADIIIPDDLTLPTIMNEFDRLQVSLPNLLFNRRERSPILFVMDKLDPIHKRSIHIDQLVIRLNTLNDWEKIIRENVQEETANNWLSTFYNKTDLSDTSFDTFFESFLRLTYLTNEEFSQKVVDEGYVSFMKNLYYFNVLNRREVIVFYTEMENAIFKWKGSPKKNYIYLKKPTEKFHLAQALELKPTISHLKTSTREVLEAFKTTIIVAYNNGNESENIYLEIDYTLYSLLRKVQEGYRPNKNDEEEAIQFVEFVDKLMNFGEKKKEILVYFPRDERFYKIKRGAFGDFTFERE